MDNFTLENGIAKGGDSNQGGGGVGGGGAFGGAGGFGAGSGAGAASTTGGSDGFGGGVGGNSFGGNGAGMGGAIFNMGAGSAHPGSGTVTLVNCTLYTNIAATASSSGGQALGGAIFNLDGDVALINDTMAKNGACKGADVYNLAYGNDIPTGKLTAASLILFNSILASPNVSGTLFSQAVNGNGTNFALVSGRHNLVVSSTDNIPPDVITQTADPKLGPLQNNDGLRPTLLPWQAVSSSGRAIPRSLPFPIGGEYRVPQTDSPISAPSRCRCLRRRAGEAARRRVPRLRRCTSRFCWSCSTSFSRGRRRSTATTPRR